MLIGARMVAQLRQKVTIQQESDSPDGQGGYTLGWTAFASNVWARIEPLKGAERLEAGALESTIMYRCTIRYRAGVTEGMRILHGSTAYNIRAVVNADERKRYLTLDLEEGVAT